LHTSRPPFTLLRLVCLIWLAAAQLQCGGCDDSNSNNATPDMAAEDMAADLAPDLAPDLGPDLPNVTCTPNEVIACRRENTPSVDVCTPQGDAIVPGSCESGQVCRQDKCVDVFCIPGSKRCEGSGDTARPQECDQEGSAFVDLAPCEGGARCEAGACLNRCELATLTQSYIGCEYWAVEMENHLLYDETEVQLPLDRFPPFAIVLANTSDDYDARITVFEDADKPANAVGSRVVGTDVPQPGLEYVTVNSEIVNAAGQRIGPIIEGPVQDLVLPRGAVMTLVLPHRRIPFGESSLLNMGYRVTSTQPVVAYQFNPLCCNYNYTNDASLLLPTGTLTNNYLYLGYAVWAGTAQARLDKPYSPTITIIGTQPDTEVTIKLGVPKGMNRPYKDLIYAPSSARITGPDSAGIIRATLQPHEVLNIAGKGAAPVEDLTGAKITATKPVAVFGGHSCAFAPFDRAACDHMESQLFPSETWGQRFVLAPLKLRNPNAATSRREGTYWKFVAQQDNTTIEVNRSLAPSADLFRPADENVKACADLSADPASGVFTLNAGQTCEFGTRTSVVAQANRPVLVGAFLSGQQSVAENASFGDHAGDPSFFLVPPEEQYRSSYSFLTPKTYFQSYVTVTMIAGFGVQLDDQSIDLTQLDFEELPAEGFVRAHIPLEPGPHTMSSDVPFGIVVYGYDDYVSYAYTGGLNLSKLNTF
jgi:hypothetical protein